MRPGTFKNACFLGREPVKRSGRELSRLGRTVPLGLPRTACRRELAPGQQLGARYSCPFGPLGTDPSWPGHIQIGPGLARGGYRVVPCHPSCWGDGPGTSPQAVFVPGQPMKHALWSVLVPAHGLYTKSLLKQLQIQRYIQNRQKNVKFSIKQTSTITNKQANNQKFTPSLQVMENYKSVLTLDL